MNKTRNKKYLVVGSTGHEHVDCLEWHPKLSANLVDYDYIILNVRSINQKFFNKIGPDTVEKYRISLIRFLKSSGTLIILTDHYKKGKNKKSPSVIYNNYFWSPININIIQENGDTIEGTRTKYEKYFSKFNKWEYFFHIDGQYQTRELVQMCGNESIFRYECCFDPYLKNREDRVLAGALLCWTEPYDHHCSDSTTELGPMVFLPLLKDIDPRHAVNLLLEDMLGKPQRALPPSWVGEIKMPLLDGINDEIHKNEEKAQKLHANIKELNMKKNELEYYKKLLFADGKELEEVIKKCLIELGGSVVPAKYAEEEYCFQYRKNEYPVEAKGNTKSVSLTDLRQIIDYLLIYDDKTGKRNKGILIGNAWKTKPLEERNKRGNPNFPPNVIERAEATNIVLVSSVDLFYIFSCFLDNRSIGKKVLDCIVKSVGLVDFSSIIKSNA